MTKVGILSTPMVVRSTVAVAVNEPGFSVDLDGRDGHLDWGGLTLDGERCRWRCSRLVRLADATGTETDGGVVLGIEEVGAEDVFVAFGVLAGI